MGHFFSPFTAHSSKQPFPTLASLFFSQKNYFFRGSPRLLWTDLKGSLL